MSYRFAQILEKFGGHLFFFSYLQAKGFHDHHKPSTKSSATFLNSKKLTSINLKVVPRCHQSQYREVTQWELNFFFFFLKLNYCALQLSFKCVTIKARICVSDPSYSIFFCRVIDLYKILWHSS